MKNLLITGGSRGIGAATALLAAADGYCICVNYRQDRAAAEAVVRKIEHSGGRAIAVQADVAREEDVLRLFETMDARLGTLAALVNNAGIVDRQMRVDQMPAARLMHLFATNVVGAFLCAREAVRRMSTRHGGQGGVIVNVSSAAARFGAPHEYVDYAATKGAIDTFTIGLAKEVAAEGIRCSAVRPGIVDTEIHAAGGEPDRIARVAPSIPLERAGRPEEVAQAILWLLSDKASYATGAILDVAGGR
jgi:NAD(P)-dependent dehydrogenase (short-subunit alcohol dehydrogenase family)